MVPLMLSFFSLIYKGTFYYVSRPDVVKSLSQNRREKNRFYMYSNLIYTGVKIIVAPFHADRPEKLVSVRVNKMKISLFAFDMI
jgi:hypothetical protein